VAVAKREWPQRWPTLIDNLLELAGAGACQTEIVLMSLRSLVEDSYSGDFNHALPTQRRRELLQGLNHVAPRALEFTVEALSFHYGNHCEQRQQAQPPDPASFRASHRVIAAAVRAAGALIELVDVAHIRDVAHIVCTLLQEPDFFASSRDALMMMAGRTIAAEHADVALEVVECVVRACGDLAPTDADAWTVAVAGGPGAQEAFDGLDDALERAKGGAKVTCAAVLKQLVHLDSHTAGEGRQRQGEAEAGLVALATRFLEHPSQVVAAAIVPAWCHIMHVEALRSREAVQAAIPRVLELVFRRMVKRGSPDFEELEGEVDAVDRTVEGAAEVAYVQGNTAAAQGAYFFNQLAFTDHREFVVFFGPFRGDVKRLVRDLATHFPSGTASLVHKYVCQTFAAYPGPSEEAVAAGVRANTCSPAYLEHEAACTLLDMLVGSVTPELLGEGGAAGAEGNGGGGGGGGGPTEEQAGLVEALRSCVQSLLNFHTADALLRMRQVGGGEGDAGGKGERGMKE
jgi:hypothetical protein